MAAIAAFAILGGSVAAVMGMVRAQRAEAAAALEAETSARVSEFMTEIFSVSDPSVARGTSVTAKEILDAGAARIRSELADQPVVQARLMTQIGDVYRSLGLYDQGRPLLEDALAMYEGEVDAPLEAAHTKNKLSYLLVHMADYDRSQRLALEARETFEALLGPGSEQGTEALNHYAFSRLRAGQDPVDLAVQLTEALPAQRQRLGPRSESVANTMDHLCWANLQAGDEVAADSMCYATLELRREILGSDHPTVGLDRSIAAYREGFQIREAAFGPHSSQLVLPLNNLAFQYLRVGDLAEAEALLRRAQDIVDRELDELDMMRLVVTTNHARVLTARERFEDANRLARVALDGLEASVGKEHWRWAVARSIQGRALSRLGAFAPAEEALSESWAILQVSQPPGATYRIDAARYFVELFEQNGRASEAERWRETLATEERSGA